jgi:hypothetical protein
LERCAQAEGRRVESFQLEEIGPDIAPFGPVFPRILNLDVLLGEQCTHPVGEIRHIAAKLNAVDGSP